MEAVGATKLGLMLIILSCHLKFVAFAIAQQRGICYNLRMKRIKRFALSEVLSAVSYLLTN